MSKYFETVNFWMENLLDSVENKQAIKLNLSKLNITKEISIDIVEKELKELGNQLALESARYEKLVFKLDKFVKHLTKEGLAYQESRDI